MASTSSPADAVGPEPGPSAGAGDGPEAAPVRDPGAQTAARGWVFIAGAKAFFVLTSTAINFLLPRVFGNPGVYGLYATAFGLLSILNNVRVAGTLQTTSKMVSEDEAHAPQTLRRGLALQGALGAALAAVVFAAAGPFAEEVLLDPALAPLFRVGACVVLAYTLYATLVGSLNGRHQFRAQAGLDAGEGDTAFLEAKIATGRHYMARHLPMTATHLARIETGAVV